MKKKIIVFILFELIFSLFAKEQIGICNKNVYNIGIIQNNIPVCFYYDVRARRFQPHLSPARIAKNKFN